MPKLKYDVNICTIVFDFIHLTVYENGNVSYLKISGIFRVSLYDCISFVSLHLRNKFTKHFY